MLSQHVAVTTIIYTGYVIKGEKWRYKW